MSKTIALLPYPKKLTLHDTTIALTDDKLIALNVADPSGLRFAAQHAPTRACSARENGILTHGPKKPKVWA